MFDPVKSAEPPTVSCITGFTSFKVFSDAFRVAILGRCSEASFFMVRITLLSFFEGSFAKAFVNFVWRDKESFLNCSSQSMRRCVPRRPISFQAVLMSSGISNAS